MATSSGPPTIEEHIDASGLGLYQLKIFIISALVAIADGMEMVVISMLRKPLQDEFGIGDMEFAMLGSVVFAGLLIGNLFGGLLADWYGRRVCLIAMGALFCVAGTASAFAQSLLQFSILRFITGIGIGSMIPVTDAYVLEWSPTEWRSKLVVGLIGVAFALGTIFAAGIGILVHEGFGDGDIWWRVFLLICVLPGLIGVPLIYFMLPESVHYLLVKGDRAEIKRLLKEMSEANGTALLADGEVAAGSEHSGTKTGEDQEQITELFGPTLIGTTAYCTVAFVSCGFIYWGSIFIYPFVLEQIHGMEITEAYSAVMLNSCIEALVYIPFVIMMDWEGIGRRWAMVVGFAIVFVTAVIAPLVVGNVTLFICTNSVLRAMVAGPFTVLYIYAGELFPSTLRTTGIAVCNSFGRLAAMSAPVVTQAAFGLSVTVLYALFGAFALAGLLAGLLFTRETLGRALPVYTSELAAQIKAEEVAKNEAKAPLLSKTGTSVEV